MNTKFIKTLFLILSISVLSGYFLTAQTPVSYEDENTQNYDLAIDIDQFNPGLIQKLVLDGINKHRREARADELIPERILTIAAKSIVESMSENELTKLEDPDETSTMVNELGGTYNSKGVATRISVKQNSAFVSYQEIANEAVKKWIESPKYNSTITNPAYFFVGINAILDLSGKKTYITVVLGNYQTFNGDMEALNEMELPISDKSYGIGPFDEKICSKLNKYNLYNLHEGLYVNDGIIYFKSDNIKELKKIIKADSNDGLAVDIIRREQYPCGSSNLIDFNLINRGILTKPIFANKIYDNNEIEYPESKSKLLVEIGELPPEIIKDYELNLVIIKEKTYCKSIPQSFLLDGGFKSLKDIHLLADSVTINSKINFIPETSDDEFIIRMPLEKGKNTFTYKEIKPYLDALDAPPFIIRDINIATFSSLEESGNKDMILNHKKAESIINALKEHQEETFSSDILATNSWSIFQNDVIGTEYEHLAFMEFDEAVKYIQKNNLAEKLEPIFVKHRFAQIQLRVSYDLREKKEQEFVLHNFNKAVEKSDLANALAIQKYIFKMRTAEKYDNNCIVDQRIPLDSKNAGLLMNKLWLQNKYELIDENILYKTLQELYKLAPNNPYIHFNLLARGLEMEDVGDEYNIYKTQSGIDNLYNSTINKRTVDNLNLEYQFKVIAALDTLEKPSPKLFESLNRIKTIFNIESATLKNSLQLAYLFINHEDYDFASRLLEVFVEDTNVNEELLFTYLSLCSVSDYKYFTALFSSSLAKAAEINKDRFCKLFAGDQFSLRVLENPQAKKLYCEKCGK